MGLFFKIIILIMIIYYNSGCVSMVARNWFLKLNTWFISIVVVMKHTPTTLYYLIHFNRSGWIYEEKHPYALLKLFLFIVINRNITNRQHARRTHSQTDGHTQFNISHFEWKRWIIFISTVLVFKCITL